jgi:TM2 domain-containing membrane protein YozV
MIPEKVLYTDGRDVTVTDSTLKIKTTAYNLSGITNLSLWTIKPERWPGVLLMLLGLALAVAGWFGVVPDSVNIQTDNGIVTGNMLALWIGIALFVIGIVALSLGKERYAVRIATAEGEKNAIVSDKREYIAQIVDAVNKAFNLGTGATNTTYVTGA